MNESEADTVSGAISSINTSGLPRVTASASFGVTYQGTIAQLRQYDSYTVTASANDQIFVRLKASWNYWPQITIRKPDGTQLASDYSSSYCVVQARASVSGTYTIIVGDREGDDTGTYSVYIQRTNNPGATTPMQYGQTVGSTISYPAEYDTYTVQANANDQIFVRMMSSWDSGPQIRIFRPDGAQLTTDYGYYSDWDLQALAPVSGTYTILVGDYNGDGTGTYSLFVQRLNNPGGAVPLLFGQTISSTIDNFAEYDTYTVQASTNDELFFRIRAGWEYYPEIRVYRPDGSPLTSDDFYTYGDLQARSFVPGTYTILVGDLDGDNTGTYSVFVQRLNNPGYATPMQFGQSVGSTIGNLTEYDAFTVQANANDELFVRVSAGWEYSPEIRIYRPDGTSLASGDDSPNQCELQARAFTAGTYTILIGDYSGDNTGIYSVYVQRLNNPGGATPIQFGQTSSGSIVNAVEYDSYTIQANANDELFVRLKSSWTSFPQVTVYNPDGSRLASDWGYPDCELQARATTPGTYTILVGDDGADSTGTYSVFVQRVNNPAQATPIQFGQTIGSTITNSAEYDAYTIQATANDEIFVRLRTAWDNYAEIKIFGPDGYLLASDDAWSTYNELQTRGLASGTYTILVGDSEGEGAGDYSLYCQRMNNPSPATTIGPGEIISSAISNLAEFDTYTFNPAPNTQILFRLQTSWSYYPQIRIYKPDGTLLGGNYGYSSFEYQTVIPSEGTYTVLVGDMDGDNTGTYSLSASYTAAPPPPVTAAFTADQTSGTAPLTVQFTDTSTGSPTSWSWQFGDGGTSALQHPSHSYTVGGTYNVTLTVSRAGTADDSEEKIRYVIVTAPLVVVTVPGATGLPRDLNSDGKYEDINGNGRPDFADVVLYFNQMSWIAANEPATAFDYNGNGRIDFADVVWLFNNL